MKALCLEAEDLSCRAAHDLGPIGGRRFGILWSDLAQAAFTIDDIDGPRWWPEERECLEAWEATP